MTLQPSVAIAMCRKTRFPPQIVLLQYKVKPYPGFQNLGCHCKILGAILTPKNGLKNTAGCNLFRGNFADLYGSIASWLSRYWLYWWKNEMHRSCGNEKQPRTFLLFFSNSLQESNSHLRAHEPVKFPQAFRTRQSCSCHLLCVSQ